MLSLPFVLALAQACAPSAAPETLLSVAQVESGLDPFTIGVNAPAPLSLHPPTAAAAAAAAQALIRQGRNVDLGIAQINIANLRRLHLSVEDAFDPCRNLAAAAQVLNADYRRAAAAEPEVQTALRTAISLYNTGDEHRGFRNGYVAKVVAAAERVTPAIQAVRPVALQPAAPDPVCLRVARSTTAGPQSTSLDVFARLQPSAVWPQSRSSPAGEAASIAEPSSAFIGDHS